METRQQARESLEVRRGGIGADVQIASEAPVPVSVHGPAADDNVFDVSLAEALKKRRGIEVAHRRARKASRNSSAARSRRIASSTLRPTPFSAFLRTASRRALLSRRRSTSTRAKSSLRTAAIVPILKRLRSSENRPPVSSTSPATNAAARHRRGWLGPHVRPEISACGRGPFENTAPLRFEVPTQLHRVPGRRVVAGVEARSAMEVEPARP